MAYARARACVHDGSELPKFCLVSSFTASLLDQVDGCLVLCTPKPEHRWTEDVAP